MEDLRNESGHLRMENSASPYDPKTKPHPDAVVYLVQEPTVPKHGGRVIDTTPSGLFNAVRHPG